VVEIAVAVEAAIHDPTQVAFAAIGVFNPTHAAFTATTFTVQ
jgi:hypothetical protein